MHFFFGDKKQEKKITNELNVQIKSSLKPQFCQFCQKVPSNKIAFVPNHKIGFTCNNCELNAVGGQLKNLGDKTLVTNEKFADTLTKSLISYQSSQTQPPQQLKQIQNSGKSLIKKTSQLIEKIKVQCGGLKFSSEEKLKQILKQSQQQNSVYVFEQLTKLCKDNKKATSNQQIKSIILKRALVGQKGLHFIDQENILENNKKIDERVMILKSEMKVKLREIDDLTKWINQIEI